MALYFMQIGPDGPIKIGHAKDPYRRRSGFQTASAASIDILALVDGGRDEERAVHRLFSHLHIRGELFSPTTDLMGYIEAMPKHEKPAPRPRGRPQINEEQMPARLPEGTLARIDATLEDKESRAGFLRAAVERELKRREKASK